MPAINTGQLARIPQAYSTNVAMQRPIPQSYTICKHFSHQVNTTLA